MTTNTGFKGIDIVQTGLEIVFECGLTASGAAYTSTAPTLQLVELQSDGTIKTYDWASNTFKTTGMTSGGQTVNMTERTVLTYSAGDAQQHVGLFTYALSTVTNFTVGAKYLAIFQAPGADAQVQWRKFQYGSEQGDVVVTASGTTGQGYVQDDVRMALGQPVTLDSNNAINVSTKYVAGTAQTAGVDLGIVLPTAAVNTKLGLSTGTAWGGTISAVSANSVTLTTALGATNLPLNSLINIVESGSTAYGQSMGIASYVNSTRVLTLNQNWTVQPTIGDHFTITFDEVANIDPSGRVPIQEGTNSGQLVTTGGAVNSYVVGFLATLLTEGTTGWIAAAFKKFFNLGSPSSTMNEITLVDTTTNSTNTPGNGDFTATQKSSITAAVPTVAQNQSGMATHADVVAVGAVPSHFTNGTFVSDGVFSTAALANGPGGGAEVVIDNYITIPQPVAAASYSLGTIPFIRGDQLTVALPLMGSITGRTKLIFTAKLSSQIQTNANTDAQSIIQIEEGVGLIVFNGKSIGLTASDASLTVTNSTTGAVNLVINSAETSQIPLEDLVWDAQWWDALGQTHTPVGGAMVQVLDVTQSVS